MGLFSSIASAVAPEIIGGAFSAFGASRQNDAARRAAATQMAFQREMFQNRYQWTMADMRAAGLNPMLAYQQGAGIGGSGASYTPVNELAGIGQGVSKGVSTALAVRRQNQDLKNLKQQERNLKLQEREIDARTEAAYESAATNRESARNFSALARYHDHAATNEKWRQGGAEAANRIGQIDREFYGSEMGRHFRRAELMGNSAGAVTRAIGNVFRTGAGTLRTRGVRPGARIRRR